MVNQAYGPPQYQFDVGEGLPVPLLGPSEKQSPFLGYTGQLLVSPSHSQPPPDGVWPRFRAKLAISTPYCLLITSLRFVIAVSILGLLLVWHQTIISQNSGHSPQPQPPPLAPSSPSHHGHQLKFVSIIGRHADRAPNDPLPVAVDKHLQNGRLFWPHGFSNLTDIGRLRAHRIGLALRNHYSQYLGYNASKLLAFSSSEYRCEETLAFLLQGLFDNHWTKARGRQLVANEEAERKRLGSGDSFDPTRIKIDTSTVPSLLFKFLNNCRYRKEHPPAIDKDLMLSDEIRSLPGVKQLAEVLQNRYNYTLNYNVTGLWQTVGTELNLVRTKDTLHYTDHYADWVNSPAEGAGNPDIQLYDLLEQITLLTYRDRIQDEANYIQTGPVVTSLIESYLVALDRLVDAKSPPRAQVYADKVMAIYMTHDSVLQRVLWELNLISREGSFVERFNRWHHPRHTDLQRFLAGYKMASFGVTVRFELWDAGSPTVKLGDDTSYTEQSPTTFVYVLASAYNEEEASERVPVTFYSLDLGAACRSLFGQQNPQASAQALESFFFDPFSGSAAAAIPPEACPFELLRNVTSHLMVDEQRLSALCD